VPGSRARLDGEPRRIIRNQLAIRGIETINQDLVQAEIAGQDKLVAGVASYKVSVRAFLALMIDARTMVLDRYGRFSEMTITLKR
jgi:hypothetical protein